MSRVFFYPDNKRYVFFTEEALMHMYRYAQRWVWQKEAGGELFTTQPDEYSLIISVARGPGKKDKRTRTSWVPDPVSAIDTRTKEYEKGRHVVGLWHTHPEPLPSPSCRDQSTTWEYLETFGCNRTRYLMVILGNSGKIPELVVWVAESKERRWEKLVEAFNDVKCEKDDLRGWGL